MTIKNEVKLIFAGDNLMLRDRHDLHRS